MPELAPREARNVLRQNKASKLPATAQDNRTSQNNPMVGKFHVLVVDDDPDKSDLLKVALSMEGYDVQTASNGREALQAIERFPPDLVITDVMMPEVDGFELARRIRENPGTRFIPIILQSSLRMEAKDFR